MAQLGKTIKDNKPCLICTIPDLFLFHCFNQVSIQYIAGLSVMWICLCKAVCVFVNDTKVFFTSLFSFTIFQSCIVTLTHTLHAFQTLKLKQDTAMDSFSYIHTLIHRHKKYITCKTLSSAVSYVFETKNPQISSITIWKALHFKPKCSC